MVKQLTESEILKEKYPSIELAYPIALASYETMIKRFDGIDTKIQNSMAFAIATFVIIPTIGNSKQLSFNSLFFIISVLFLTASVIISFVARKIGEVETLSPMKIYNKSLHLEETEFKRDVIFFAGESFEKMKNIINRKWQLNVLSLLFYCAAVIAAALWAAVGVRA